MNTTNEIPFRELSANETFHIRGERHTFEKLTERAARIITPGSTCGIVYGFATEKEVLRGSNGVKASMEEKSFGELEIGAQFRPISVDVFEKIDESAAKIVTPGSSKRGFIHGFNSGKQVITEMTTTKDETQNE